MIKSVEIEMKMEMMGLGPLYIKTWNPDDGAMTIEKIQLWLSLSPSSTLSMVIAIEVELSGILEW